LDACLGAADVAACTVVAAAAEPGCRAGNGVDCHALAEANIARGGDPDAANLLLWKACDETDPVDPWGCLRLADRVEHDIGTLPAAARGDVSWLRNQACDLQLDYACAPHARW